MKLRLRDKVLIYFWVLLDNPKTPSPVPSFPIVISSAASSIQSSTISGSVVSSAQKLGQKPDAEIVTSPHSEIVKPSVVASVEPAGNNFGGFNLSGGGSSSRLIMRSAYPFSHSALSLANSKSPSPVSTFTTASSAPSSSTPSSSSAVVHAEHSVQSSTVSGSGSIAGSASSASAPVSNAAGPQYEPLSDDE